jgi:heme-degrading monooxygenase HmoA
MAVIVVTRLRLRDAKLFDQFFTSAVAVVEQAQGSPGNLGADVLAEANNTYWTRTAWRDQGAMQAFVRTEPHRGTMAHIDEWCDEATFVNWEETGGDLPEWQESYSRLLADGRVAALTTPSDAHHTRDFPAPVVPS